MTHRHRAVITGIGPVTCIGIGKIDFWDSIRKGKSGIKRIEHFDTSRMSARNAGTIEGWDPAHFFPPKRVKRLDRYAQFSVASAGLALADAGLSFPESHRGDRIGVSFGTALGGVSGAESKHQHFLNEGARRIDPILALQVFGGSAHSNIAIEYGLTGVGTTNSNSCASGTVGVGEALRYIRDGWADIVIAGGAEAPLSPLTFGAFAVINSMSRWEGEPASQACRPFDATRDGFVMAEGAASLVIEELEHARKRGARIYAEVLGYRLNNDAYHMTAPRPDSARSMAAMRDALADAKIEPGQVDYINAHASSTPLNDAAETRAIKAVFGEHAYRIPVSGTKAHTAHALGASGAIEAAICALAIHDRFVPATLNHSAPDPECDLDVVPNVGREADLQIVLSNSFGFGGINASLVLGALS
jgi:3-oxoacyl-[acyl-carrier-protein] synthase II